MHVHMCDLDGVRSVGSKDRAGVHVRVIGGCEVQTKSSVIEDYFYIHVLYVLCRLSHAFLFSLPILLFLVVFLLFSRMETLTAVAVAQFFDFFHGKAFGVEGDAAETFFGCAVFSEIRWRRK